MKELIQYLATSLVDDPDAVQVTENEKDNTVLIELRVAKDDLGKVIGKQGRTVKAMRTLLVVTAGRKNMRSRLEIME